MTKARRSSTRYAGVYRGRASSREAPIEIDGARLVIDGLLWPRNPLIPKARDQFHLESWPLDVTFTSGGASGVATGFTVSEKTFWWGRLDPVFDRIG